MEYMTPNLAGSGNADHRTDDGGRRHGEYKVPGGKLVVVDFDVVDARFANVSLSGDFFLEPDEALLDINRALTGLPESAASAVAFWELRPRD
jgi:lipoate-protein ligase A